MSPETRFTQSGDVSIAYQVFGEGPRDLLIVPGFISHLEAGWDSPAYARFLERLASFSRVIQFDKRGTGLSDRVSGIPTIEERSDDVRAVLDAVGSAHTALFGISEGGPMSVVFSAANPDRVTALILYGSIAKGSWAPDYPWGDAVSDGFEEWMAGWRRDWGKPYGIEAWAPSMADDPHFRDWWARYLRLGASPSAVIALFRMNREIDVRPILPIIQVPTLVLHRTGDRPINIGEGRYLANHIPNAKFVELPGEDHLWWVGDSDAIVDEIEEFLTGARHPLGTDRRLMTVLFTDIAGSTQRASELGDRRWSDVLAAHNMMMEKTIAQFRGEAVKSTGDGYLALFDGSGRAIECALSAARAVRNLGLSVRSGLHTGEVETIGKDVGGIAVHIAARVMEKAPEDEVWASRTVKDLVVGSRFKFTESGIHCFKGVDEGWPLYRVNV
jgi:class 3 adenylate cyclase